MCTWQVELLLDVFDANSDGMMSYDEFANMAYEVLVHAAREKAVTDATVSAATKAVNELCGSFEYKRELLAVYLYQLREALHMPTLRGVAVEMYARLGRQAGPSL